VRLANRVQKLERTEVVKRHLLPLDQFQRALNDAAVRLTGRDLSFVLGDEPTLERVMDDLEYSLIRKLSDADLESLIREMKRIVSGNDTTALEPRSGRDHASGGVRGTCPRESATV
jgi:hypothetical protein